MPSIYYPDVVWDDSASVPTILFQFQSGLNPPDWTTYDSPLVLPAFSSTVAEYLQLIVQLPHKVKANSELRPHIHWAPSDTGAGGVVWRLEYSIQPFGSVNTSPTTLDVTDAADGTARKHQVASWPAVTGATFGESTILMAVVSRQPGEAGDTYGSDAFLLSVDWHHQNEKAGTAPEFPS